MKSGTLSTSSLNRAEYSQRNIVRKRRYSAPRIGLQLPTVKPSSLFELRSPMIVGRLIPNGLGNLVCDPAMLFHQGLVPGNFLVGLREVAPPELLRSLPRHPMKPVCDSVGFVIDGLQFDKD